jgi:hypothetical protein
MPAPIDDTRREKVLHEALQCSTLREVARRSGVSERSVRRFVKEPQFRETLTQLRNQLRQELLDGLLAMGHEALDRMRTLLQSSDERVALMAAKENLCHVCRRTPDWRSP